MELQQMRYVVAIAETGGFTRAAERCHVVQSALSHQVARLERELGAELFVRHRRRVALTAAGEAFLPAARSALAAADLARAEVAASAGLLRGTLRLGAVPTFSALDVLDVLRRFRDRYPDVEVALHGLRSEALVEEVRAGRSDLALIGVPEGYRIPAGLAGRHVATDRMVVLAAPGHPLARRAARTVGLADLAGETFVDFPAGSQARLETDEAFARLGVTRRVAYEVDHSDTLVRFARAGLALALLPPGAVDADVDLDRIALRDPPTRAQHVVWRTAPSPAARAFLDLAGVEPLAVEPLAVEPLAVEPPAVEPG